MAWALLGMVSCGQTESIPCGKLGRTVEGSPPVEEESRQGTAAAWTTVVAGGQKRRSETLRQRVLRARCLGSWGWEEWEGRVVAGCLAVVLGGWQPLLNCRRGCGGGRRVPCPHAGVAGLRTVNVSIRRLGKWLSLLGHLSLLFSLNRRWFRTPFLCQSVDSSREHLSLPPAEGRTRWGTQGMPSRLTFILPSFLGSSLHCPTYRSSGSPVLITEIFDLRPHLCAFCS